MNTKNSFKSLLFEQFNQTLTPKTINKSSAPKTMMMNLHSRSNSLIQKPQILSERSSLTQNGLSKQRSTLSILDNNITSRKENIDRSNFMMNKKNGKGGHKRQNSCTSHQISDLKELKDMFKRKIPSKPIFLCPPKLQKNEEINQQENFDETIPEQKIINQSINPPDSTTFEEDISLNKLMKSDDSVLDNNFNKINPNSQLHLDLSSILKKKNSNRYEKTSNNFDSINSDRITEDNNNIIKDSTSLQKKFCNNHPQKKAKYYLKTEKMGNSALKGFQVVEINDCSGSIFSTERSTIKSSELSNTWTNPPNSSAEEDVSLEKETSSRVAELNLLLQNISFQVKKIPSIQENLKNQQLKIQIDSKSVCDNIQNFVDSIISHIKEASENILLELNVEYGKKIIEIEEFFKNLKKLDHDIKQIKDDIEGNYDRIIHNMDHDPFTSIMKAYKQKLQTYDDFVNQKHQKLKIPNNTTKIVSKFAEEIKSEFNINWNLYFNKLDDNNQSLDSLLKPYESIKDFKSYLNSDIEKIADSVSKNRPKIKSNILISFKDRDLFENALKTSNQGVTVTSTHDTNLGTLSSHLFRTESDEPSSGAKETPRLNVKDEYDSIGHISEIKNKMENKLTNEFFHSESYRDNLSSGRMIIEEQYEKISNYEDLMNFIENRLINEGVK